MKSLNIYVNEGLADWGEDDTFNKKISKQTTKAVIKQEIIEWIQDNFVKVKKTKLKFDFSTTPITVDYDGNIEFKENRDSLTNGMFQWGEVGGYFDCSYCQKLKTLEGAPKKVGGNFYCRDCNSITSLKGAPEKVEGYFGCLYCISLKSLEGAPKKVGSDFNCGGCASLTTLEGAPKNVGKNFHCRDCKSLTSLEGSPMEVGGYFSCSYCPSLKTLKGAPETVGGYFDCIECGKKFTEEDVKKVSDVKGKINC